MKDLIFKEVSSIVVIFEFVDSLIEQSSFESFLILEDFNYALNFILLFFQETGFSICLELNNCFVDDSLSFFSFFEVVH